jgi:ABC-type xylose transport system permease subunit
MMDEKLLVIGHAVVTWFLCGLIMVVQVVHYPLFEMVDRARFAAFETAHSNRIGLIVAPAMLLEVIAVGALLVMRPTGIPVWALWLGTGLVAVVWLTTAFVSVPQHAVLANGFDEAAHRRLVDTNWIRTLAWLARGMLAFWFLLRLN